MRRGPKKVRMAVGESGASASVVRRARSSAARACIRAGISSLKSSKKSSGMSALQRRLDVGLGKVAALEQQGFAITLGEGIGETVAEIEPRPMMATSKIVVGRTTPVGILNGDVFNSQA